MFSPGGLTPPVIQGCPVSVQLVYFDQIGSDWFPPDLKLRLAVDSPGLVINRGEGARAATKQQSALDFSRRLEEWVENLKQLLVTVPQPFSVLMLFARCWIHGCACFSISATGPWCICLVTFSAWQFVAGFYFALKYVQNNKLLNVMASGFYLISVWSIWEIFFWVE